MSGRVCDEFTELCSVPMATRTPQNNLAERGLIPACASAPPAAWAGGARNNHLRSALFAQGWGSRRATAYGCRPSAATAIRWRKTSRVYSQAGQCCCCRLPDGLLVEPAGRPPCAVGRAFGPGTQACVALARTACTAWGRMVRCAALHRGQPDSSRPAAVRRARAYLALRWHDAVATARAALCSVPCLSHRAPPFFKLVCSDCDPPG